MMRKSERALSRLCCWGVMALALSFASTAQAQLVISQLFGGAGGNASAADGDFVEIFNRSCAVVNLGSYSVQVATSATSATPTWRVVPLPNFPLNPGQYYCIRLFTINPAIGQVGTPFAQDLDGTLQVGDVLLSSSGKAAIVLGSAALPSVACPPQSAVVDFVNYSSSAGACTEGARFVASLGGAAAGRAVSRKSDVNADGVGDGCQDTDVNNNDFLADLDPAMPRTTASAFNVCAPQVTYGACDLPSGSCQIVAGATACANLGGVYQGDCQGCPVPQACCLPTNPVTCTLTDQASCEIDGGVFQAGQFVCPPTPACPGIGRCCDDNGGCIVTFQVLCVGTFAGVGTTCTGTPCQGRCCDDQGNCNLTGPAQCTGTSVFAGIGTTCTGTLCQGRCCGTDGSCTLTGPANCTGVFAGLGSICSPSGSECQGRCCDNQGGCTLTGQDNCSGTFGGVGTNCANFRIYSNAVPATVTIPDAGLAAPSVINVPDTFTIQDANVRIKIQHTFRGDLNICLQAPNGGPNLILTAGTCTGTGSCGGEDNFNVEFDDEGFAIVCASVNLSNLTGLPDLVVPNNPLAGVDGLPSNGDWTLQINDDAGGDSGTLLEWALLLDDGVGICGGACCNTQTGACTITGPASCVGTFQGIGSVCSPSPCAPNGACCNGTVCSIQSNVDCTAAGGTFAGVGSTCTNPICFVPCCLDTGVCTQMTLAACQAIGNSSPGAPGGACPVGSCRGRCCTPDGTCSFETEAACQPPRIFGGLGSVCSGDGNDCNGRCCQAGGACAVTSQNGCIGLGGTFTLGASCSAITDVVFEPLNLPFADNNPAGVTNVQNVSGLGGNIVDLDVDVKALHTFFGDLIIRVEHLGTIVTIVDRPGVPILSTVGCSANDPDIVLDDEGTGGNVEDLCSAANNSAVPVPPSPPNYVPNNPLSAFDGLSPNGDWTITVSDNAALDTGTLVRWSLHISTDDIICPVGGCTCRGDVNGDTVVNGKDIRNFAACLVSGGAGCTCADVNNSGTATTADIPAFITAVLTGACAP